MQFFEYLLRTFCVNRLHFEYNRIFLRILWNLLTYIKLFQPQQLDFGPFYYISKMLKIVANNNSINAKLLF